MRQRPSLVASVAVVFNRPLSGLDHDHKLHSTVNQPAALHYVNAVQCLAPAAGHIYKYVMISLISHDRHDRISAWQASEEPDSFQAC